MKSMKRKLCSLAFLLLAAFVLAPTVIGRFRKNKPPA
jgi:hypothetical protein